MTKRKVPLRKCIVTEEMRPKQELIRVVRNKEGEVFVDPTGKKNGRGAYLSLNHDIINIARQTNALGKHLKVAIPGEIYNELLKLTESS